MIKFFTLPHLDSSAYFPQIDGLRAFAVLAVFVSHMLKIPPFTNIDLGQSGVILFFVLSGVLISRILLMNLTQSDQHYSTKLRILRSFYLRRFIRIFPIYYLTIGVVFIIGYEPVRDHIFWILTYTTNISQAIDGNNYEFAVHLWTLGIEEQFYLVFPFIILFLKKHYIPHVLIALIMTSIGYRIVGSLIGFDWITTGRFTLGALDSLCLGALYTYLVLFNNQNQLKLRMMLIACLILGSITILACVNFSLTVGTSIAQDNLWYQAFFDSGIAMLSIVLIHLAMQNRQWVLGRVLELSFLRYIGKISYGAYLYHSFVRSLPINTTPELGFLLLSILSLGLASLSWHIIEEPINRLKRHFPYLKKEDLSKKLTD